LRRQLRRRLAVTLAKAVCVHGCARLEANARVVECPLCAKSGHYAAQQKTSLFDHLVGSDEQAKR
jgi:hypothetical protein